jgi:hypothetical protein
LAGAAGGVLVVAVIAALVTRGTVVTQDPDPSV